MEVFVMKMNVKMFNSLQNPFDVQEIDGKNVEIHYMNDTNYLARYAGQGQFSVWSSDGKDYKLLIERGYYEELKPLFSAEVNNVWLKLYTAVDKVRKGMLFKVVLPILAFFLAVIIVTASVEMFKKYQTVVLIVSLVVVLLVNIVQSSFIRKKIDQERDKSVQEIQLILGADVFEELIFKQRKYHEQYFKFEDPVEEPLKEEVLEAEVKAVAEEPEMEAELEPVPEPEVEVPVVKEVPFVVGFELLTVDELRTFAKGRNVANFSTLRKQELIESLPNQLNDLKVSELRALARAKEIPNFSQMRKQELIDAIKN